MDSTKNVTLEDLLHVIQTLSQKVDQLSNEVRDLKQELHESRPFYYVRREDSTEAESAHAHQMEKFDSYEGVNQEQARQIWDSLLHTMQTSLSKSSYETWLKNTAALSYEADVLTVGTQNDFARDWLESRYKHTVEEALHQLNERETSVEFVVPYLL